MITCGQGRLWGTCMAEKRMRAPKQERLCCGYANGLWAQSRARPMQPELKAPALMTSTHPRCAEVPHGHLPGQEWIQLLQGGMGTTWHTQGLTLAQYSGV